MKGNLIVIEGPDGVGKETQTLLLKERLEKAGKIVRVWHFPLYESPWGVLIRQYLDGKSPFQFDPGYASTLYAADRALAAPEITAALAEGTWVLCDRYVPSNMAFQGVSFASLSERDAYDTWLEWLEYEHFMIPRPDLTLVLTLPSKLSLKRTEERRESVDPTSTDIFEQDAPFVEKVTAEYSRLAEAHGWPQIECAEQSGTQLARESIAEKVWQIVLPLVDGN